MLADLWAAINIVAGMLAAWLASPAGWSPYLPERLEVI